MIGYYVHHHGRGHLTRAISVCARLHSPVTLLSSMAVPDRPHLDAVLLPRDDEAPNTLGATAHGALHWAPLHDHGLRRRMQTIAEWVTATQPSVVVVDVSVEVAMMVRLLGVPVIVVAMPGERTDPPHELVHRVADHILAPWPQELYEPAWLRHHSAKTTYVGGISRFDGRDRTPPASDAGIQVLILDGAGGSSLDMAAVVDCATAHQQYRWTALGVKDGPWLADPWPALCEADVVVSSAGQSSVADIAAARTPAILVSAPRPFAEQHATSRAIHDAGLALVRDRWPTLDEWPVLIERARGGDPDRWRDWQTDGAAARAAATIERVAAEHRLAPTP